MPDQMDVGSVPRLNVLGVGVSAINLDQAVTIIDRWIRNRDRQYICLTPVHSIMDCVFNPSLRRVYNNSGLTTPDGMPLVWWLKSRGFSWVDRVYGPDLMERVFEDSRERGWSHFLYGGGEGVAASLAKVMEGRLPGINVVGAEMPPFHQLDAKEDQETLTRINRANPDILWLGISSPKQDRWMADHLGRVEAPVMIGVGAAFDILSGRVPQAPRWVQRSGLEWIFRWIHEPRRLAGRYLRYPLFPLLLLLQRSGILRYTMDR